MTPVVSLIVVSWRSASVLADCLETFIEEVGDLPHEIIIVENGTHDGAEQVAARLAPTALFIQNATNRGLPAANNQGIAAATGEFVLISNPDVRYAAGSIRALLGCAARHPNAAFVVPRLVHADGSLQPCVGDLPHLREALTGRALQGVHAKASGFWWHGWAHDEERAVGHAAEASYLVRRSSVAAMGLQDERFVLDWEGVEWARRAARTGWEIWFCPDAQVMHVGGVSLVQAPVRWILGSHRGIYLYFADGAGPLRRAALATVVSARAGAKLLARGVDRRLYDRARPRTGR
jgi:N-acetylglucosaminyl-diphospho-decaprenol L-rhamnosyltransferase